MSDKKQLIEKTLEEIRPHLVADGGDIEFVSYNKDSNIVNVRLKGACVGCPMAQMTLKQGVEQMLKQKVDKDIEVQDAT